jgi:hypothetical protein
MMKDAGRETSEKDIVSSIEEMRTDKWKLGHKTLTSYVSNSSPAFI